ncbi:monoamine oxidase [Actinoalloteichus hoggarensis]|uniref:Flavin-dependent L-tryptophan oxidase RebO n=1 Tax=Actinoalloteichus hoggarensis TaxID=1470176 RepID=A0A221W0D2_9PSEU|nr:NAD(P)/FAD-dependent oxidoreductase [Actinoalloteichus hoggarensis]ASO19243.1 Flavin-dependent L-tryptophan oxidase RebO precursor [Actinoalloteichus hoggarensis]MBB5920481.1 monoamine oxidase [Actinoalloteichus hoggarensis]
MGNARRPGDAVGRRSFLKAAGVAGAVPALGVMAGIPAAASPPGHASNVSTAPLQPPPDDPEKWARCLQVARDLLVVGPDDEDLKLEYLKILIDDGLPRTTSPKNVLILGAGIAGLAAATLLKQAGHRVTILEANADRVGGRIKTFRTAADGGGAPFRDPRQYAEAGAMRLPDFHPLTLALADRLGLHRRLFFNVDVVPGTGNQNAPVPAVVYRSHTGEVWRRGPANTDFRAPDAASNTWLDANGVQVRRSEYAADPRAINGGFGVPESDLARTAGALLDAAVDPLRDYYSDVGPDGVRVDRPIAEQVEGWARLIYDFDGHSMDRYLREEAGLSDATVDAIGTLQNVTSRLPLSLVHSFRGLALISPSATYWELDGGSWQLPEALRTGLVDEIRMNRRAVRIEYYDPDRPESATDNVGPDGPAVWVETTTETGGDETEAGDILPERESFTADVAIVTLPLSSLRHVQVEPLMSYPKRRAVIEIHYDSATKVLLEFSRRWWEFTEDDWRRELDAISPGLYRRYQSRTAEVSDTTRWLGAARSVDAEAIPERQKEFYARHRQSDEQATRPADHVFGGGSATDNPNRFMYYPSHPIEGSPGGVVLAAYVWADDAARWDSMEDDERYAYALRGMTAVHGNRIEVFYTGAGRTQSWLRNRYAFGEAAVLTAGQLSRLQAGVRAPEGPLHFAGDHTSVKPAWIEGALESAVRAALEVHTGEVR